MIGKYLRRYFLVIAVIACFQVGFTLSLAHLHAPFLKENAGTLSSGHCAVCDFGLLIPHTPTLQPVLAAFLLIPIAVLSVFMVRLCASSSFHTHNKSPPLFV